MLLDLINQFRSQAQVCSGRSYSAVPAVRWSGVLEQSATRHSIDMALNNHFNHTGTDGSSPFTRMSQAGYTGATYMAENIAAGNSSAVDTFNQWRYSTSGHCEAMMSPSVSEIGASCRQRSGTTYTYYWTLNLGGR